MTMILKLSDEWGERLRQIAQKEGKTLVAVVEDGIRAKIDAGVIDGGLPGVSIERDGETVSISTSSLRGEVSLGDAMILHEALEALAKQPAVAKDLEARQKFAELVGKLSGIKVERMAGGVRLTSPLTGRKHPMTFSVAEEFADQLGKTIGA